MTRTHRNSWLLIVALATGAVAGCDQSVTDVSRATAQAAVTLPTPVQQQGQVCVSGPAGTYTFSVSETDPLNVSTFNVTIPNFNLGGDSCTLVATSTSTGFGSNATITVTLLSAPAGVSLDSITKVTYLYQSTSDPTPASTTTILPGAGASFDLGLELAALLVFHTSSTPTGGGEGCTPGYWKQSQHFDSWVGFTPDQQFSSVFEDAFSGMTLLEVLKQGGGGLNALGRHTVAALLNAANSGVDFGMTTQQVIDAFNAVFPGGDFEGQKNIFAAANESGCPLN